MGHQGGPPPARGEHAYSFGDNPTAGRRLDVLAEVFRPATDSLLRRLPARERRTVLDLGCGPGHTTARLAARFPGADVVGLDNSPAFVADATRRAPAGVRFVRHDVTRLPFPDGPPDVVYARHLLAHLPDPPGLVGRWAAELAAGGLLALEETEWMRTADPDFTRYLALVAALLGARGTELYVGSLLAGLVAPPGTNLAHSGVLLVKPTAGQAATMFSLNLATVRHDRLVQDRYPARELDTLAEALARRTTDDRRGAITWGVRQLVLRRD